jgi:tyrosine-protein kinase Etk/Wzc
MLTNYAPSKPNNRSRRQQGDDLDIEKYFRLFIGNWHWFTLSVLLFMGAAFFYNRYAIRIYNVSATMLIEDEKNNSGMMNFSGVGNANMTSGFGLFPSMKNLQNQTLILTSQNQVSKTINTLDFEVSYYKKEILGTREILSEAPFIIVPDKSKAQPVGITFYVTILSDSLVQISSEATAENIIFYNYSSCASENGPANFSVSGKFKYGSVIEGPGYCFTVLPVGEAAIQADNETYLFKFRSYGSLQSEWKSRLTLAPMQKESSMVELSIQSDCPQKAAIFINKHMEVYLQHTLDKKNLFATNTINFIDTQLAMISDSLGATELSLQNFRKENNIVDLSYQGQQLFEQSKILENEKAAFRIKKDYLGYLGDYLNRNMDSGDLVAPSVMGIDDPVVNSLVIGINRMADEKAAMGGSGGNNPLSVTLNSQIKNAKASLGESVRNMMNNINMAISDIDSRIGSLMTEVHKLPETERKLFGIERIFKLNDNIYTYLLQQRYSAQIAKASNTPENEIIDMAKTNPSFIKPGSMKNYAVGLFLGFLIPGGIILLISLLNNKISSEDDIRQISDLPIAGQILHSERESQTVVLSDPNSHVSEAFRSLRTRLQFFTREKVSPVILITSSMSSEGKTFVAMNLAAACSIASIKTVIIGFDLRRPKNMPDLGITNGIGVSNYLIGQCSVEDILHETDHKNLWVIASGPVPPNPAELVSSEKTREFFDELKKMFDYIIVDSAPIGIVSDSFFLAALADITLLTIRHNITLKKILENTISETQANGISGISLLMNDITLEKSLYGYKGLYKYSYGYSGQGSER